MKLSLMSSIYFLGATVAAGLAVYQTRSVDALNKWTKGKGLPGDPKGAAGTASYFQMKAAVENVGEGN